MGSKIWVCNEDANIPYMGLGKLRHGVGREKACLRQLCLREKISKDQNLLSSYLGEFCPIEISIIMEMFQAVQYGSH